MRFIPRKSLPHEIPPWVKSGEIYFFTLGTRTRGTETLTRPTAATALLAAVSHYHTTGRWHARLFLLMPDHLHALLAFPPHATMREVWRDWKRYTARTVGVEWERDVFEHRLRDHENLERKARYIRENPVRQGWVATAEEWPWYFEA